MFGKAISNMMIKPGKSPVFETPDQYNLDYEDVTFTTKDGVTLSAWLVKGGVTKSSFNHTLEFSAQDVGLPLRVRE